MKKGQTYFSLFTLVTLVALLLSLLTGTMALATKKPPLFAKVALLPFVIELQPFEGASKRPDDDKILQELSRQATKQAERTLRNKRIAGGVKGVSTDKATGEVTVTGVVRLPTTLPPRIIGFTAATRRGIFATGKVVLRKPDGSVIAEEEVNLSWGDGWWLNGARTRHNVRLEDALADFVRKAADRDLQRIAKKLRVNERSESKHEEATGISLFSTS